VDDSDVSHGDPRRLSGFLDPAELDRRIWRESELEAILRHQLSTAVEFDLGRMNHGSAQKLSMASAAEGLLLRSYGDLFRHPCPPVELLILTKDFAKRHLHHPESPLPRQIAKVLYSASIVAAMLRCRRRITSLSDAALKMEIEWALGQTWLDGTMRSLLQEGLAALADGTGK
jgi:hypothetical protein